MAHKVVIGLGVSVVEVAIAAGIAVPDRNMAGLDPQILAMYSSLRKEKREQVNNLIRALFESQAYEAKTK